MFKTKPCLVIVMCAGISSFATGSAFQITGKNPANAGADMPFITLEAESAATVKGSVVRLSESCPWPSVPEQEASGHAYAELKKTGDYIEFVFERAANAMVIRHCIPDAPNGGGISATLGLYVNGERRQNLTLSSKHNWLYGDGVLFENGQSETPGSYPHVFWDETRFFIEGGISAGDAVRLQKDSGDTAKFYRIDLIEPELVDPPLSCPENALSVVDYGAAGKSADVDTAAIKRCIEDAKAQGKTVWFPAGNYLQNEFFVLDGVKVQGAGMWHTVLYETVGNYATNWAGNAGFRLEGTGAGVFDLSLDSSVSTHRPKSHKAFFGVATNWIVENVWISHIGVGFWMAGKDGVIRNCRVRCTYADGININNGQKYETDNVLVENNHVRGTGDDGLAILCSSRSPGITTRVTLRSNTVSAVWWGANCDLAGGENHRIENNLLTDGGGFVVNMPSSFPMSKLKDTYFKDNVLIRCGKRKGLAPEAERGAIWIFPQTDEVEGFIVENNKIYQSAFHGIHCTGKQRQNIVFKGNEIKQSGRSAVRVDVSATGTGVFEANISTQSGSQPFVNKSTTYHVTEKNNSWQ
ncbi:MAG: right-handed parallel beta-helix repeat-containing protein [Kiritimatiellales bacterium]